MNRTKRNTIGSIISEVEKKTGYVFSRAETFQVLLFTVRKCQINGKGDDYIPILFENELMDYIARSEINSIFSFSINNEIIKEAVFNV